MLALASNKIVMTALAELSPIDPTISNQFNPRDPNNKQALLGIAVEDVTAYHEFWNGVLGFDRIEQSNVEQRSALLQPYLTRLATEVHPIALGNVHRGYLQIRIVAEMILRLHYETSSEIMKIIDSLTKSYYSHVHMINRHEARRILGDRHVEFADDKLSAALDSLLRQYEDDFELRHPFFLGRYMGDDVEKDARFIGGVIESTKWSYLYETLMKMRQYPAPPSGVQLQIPPGTPLPLLPGLPRRYEWQTLEQGWRRNVLPKGVTV